MLFVTDRFFQCTYRISTWIYMPVTCFTLVCPAHLSDQIEGGQEQRGLRMWYAYAIKGAVLRQSSSFCLIFPITCPQLLWKLHVKDKIRDPRQTNMCAEHNFWSCILQHPYCAYSFFWYMPIIPFVYPPNFCAFLDDCKCQDELKAVVMQNLGMQTKSEF